MGPAEPGETIGDYSVIDMISHGQECGCYSFVILFLALLGLRCCVGFSLVGVSKGHPLFVMSASQCGGFSCCGTWVGSRACELQ